MGAVAVEQTPHTCCLCGGAPTIWYIGKRFFCRAHKAEAYAAGRVTFKKLLEMEADRINRSAARAMEAVQQCGR